MSDETSSRQAIGRAFERKVKRATWALIFEQLWVRLWIVLAVFGVFLALSFAGLWPLLGDSAHLGVLALLGLGLIAGLIVAGPIKVPAREDAIRRIEKVSGVPHRPATSYEDTLSAASVDPETMTLWKAHRHRMEQLLSRLRVGKPQPRTDRYDPYAIRALGLLSLLLVGTLLGTGTADRVRQAFRLSSADALANTRLDAWISPPAYTGQPPLMLADGSKPATPEEAAAQDGSRNHFEVPHKSILVVRASGSGLDRLGLEIVAGAGEPEQIQAPPRKSATDVSELRYELKHSAKLRVMNGRQEQTAWIIDVKPDELPKIRMNRLPDLTPRGSLKLSYTAEDDYGVASASVKFDRAPPEPGDQALAWARPEPLRGPRWPRTKPPAYSLRVPHGNPKEVHQFTYVEFAQHPWAGRKVIMTLEVKDVAGQIGRSEPFEMNLPEKQFTRPLARALIEQRKKLIDDHRYRSQVRTALAAITHAPEEFFDEASIYLGIRSVYHRLMSDRTKAGMRSVIDQLWQIAVRIEDGDLSEAEQRLKDAREKLAKALESGASEEEIEALMKELRQALGEFMEQMAKDNANQEQADGQNPDTQQLDQQDLEQMMRQLEESAKNGSREEAQQLLSQMQDIMERLQKGAMSKEMAEHTMQMQELSKELNDMSGEQQQLMDETFEELRKQDGGQQQQGFGKPNTRNAPGGDDEKQRPGGQGQGKQSGKPQRGQPGQSGQQGQDGTGQQGPSAGLGQLGERQKGLRDRLSRLQRDLREKGLGSPEQLEGARQAMERAERSLEEGDLQSATENQADALEKMRQSAQKMAQDLLARQPGRQGRNDTQRDPLGRPQRTQGPDLGTSVKVPDKIDQQRAREILEELRRRVGEATRPPVELDYLERLLKRF
jgi:uncharacterized protein (TIGR02302 family)